MGNIVKKRVLFIGAVLGALLGISAAYMFAHSQEQEGGRKTFSSRKAMALGIELVKLMRQISGLAKRN
ncbi:MAG: hypothetical protein MK000_02525 [Anaerolineales bacterium]|nr:hypothetical protein [Anaerolineales bacterium]